MEQLYYSFCKHKKCTVLDRGEGDENSSLLCVKMFRFPRPFSRTKCIPEEIVEIPSIEEILQNSSGVRNEVSVTVLSHPKIPRLSLRCLLKYQTRKSKNR